MVGLVLGGLFILIAAQFFQIGGPAAADIVKIGGAFISALSALPYREMIPRKERLATYTFLLERLRSFDSLPDEDRKDLLALANDALKETLKR